MLLQQSSPSLPMKWLSQLSTAVILPIVALLAALVLAAASRGSRDASFASPCGRPRRPNVLRMKASWSPKVRHRYLKEYLDRGEHTRVDWVERGWITPKGPRSYSSMIDEIRGSRERNPTLEVHVGSDSQVHGPLVVFATAICLYSPGNGARYYAAKEVFPSLHFPALAVRLLREVQNTVEVAECVKTSLADVFESLEDDEEALSLEECSQGITLHVDCSRNPRTKSSTASRMLTGYIEGFGYPYRVKPDSWAAWVADRFTGRYNPHSLLGENLGRT
mmetsp:Transcript_24657/g.71153  ORF Transcript_24657/g.71153 Transcript_24657/m.71153 type:complete len:277 (-) Transcript_24657:3761-4591(-)